MPGPSTRGGVEERWLASPPGRPQGCGCELAGRWLLRAGKLWLLVPSLYEVTKGGTNLCHSFATQSDKITFFHVSEMYVL